MVEGVLVLEVAKIVVPWLLAGGAAYGGVKAGLNGTRAKVDRVTDDLDEHVKEYHANQTEVIKKLSSLSTKVDLLIDHRIKEKDG